MLVKLTQTSEPAVTTSEKLSNEVSRTIVNGVADDKLPLLEPALTSLSFQRKKYYKEPFVLICCWTLVNKRV